MRGVLSSRQASFDRILIVESCQRGVTERFLKHVYEVQRSRRVDLVTCYSGAPSVFDSARGTIYSIHQPEIAKNRRKFISGLNSSPYTLVAIFCTGRPILNRWKWAIALRTRAKVLIVNEHADFFFFDLANRHLARRLLLEHFGSPRYIDARAMAGLLLVPFTIAFLLCCAALVQARRLVYRSSTSPLSGGRGPDSAAGQTSAFTDVAQYGSDD
ncbi:MAG: hypothetical protein ACRD4O_03465 [Bryobacteraceae bacterium]